MASRLLTTALRADLFELQTAMIEDIHHASDAGALVPKSSGSGIEAYGKKGPLPLTTPPRPGEVFTDTASKRFAQTQ